MTKKEIPNYQNIHTIVFDFDGIFTNNKVYVDQDGKETVRCDRSDGLGFELLKSFIKQKNWDLEYFILSKETNPVVISRAKKLRLLCKNSVNDKLDYLKIYLKKRFENDKEAYRGLLYLGNDLNDLPAMKFAGFSIAPSNSHPIVLNFADLIIDKEGGNGFIRAFIEELIFTKPPSYEQILSLL